MQDQNPNQKKHKGYIKFSIHEDSKSSDNRGKSAHDEHRQRQERNLKETPFRSLPECALKSKIEYVLNLRAPEANE